MPVRQKHCRKKETERHFQGAIVNTQTQTQKKKKKKPRKKGIKKKKKKKNKKKQKKTGKKEYNKKCHTKPYKFEKVIYCDNNNRMIKYSILRMYAVFYGVLCLRFGSGQ